MSPKLSLIRKSRYDDLKVRYPYIFEWKWYSYRRLKVRLYVGVGNILAYVFIKLGVKPNYITALYALMGLCGGILLAFPSRGAIFTATFFYYFRGILDWTDGLVARMTNQTSVNGAVFDSYGAHIGWVSLWVGMGVYLGHYTNTVFFYLTPIIPTLFAMDLYSNARDTIIGHRFLIKRVATKGTSEPMKMRKIKTIIDKVFEHNARTVDFIMFAIIFELLTPYRILWVFYSCFLIWQVMIFIVRFFMILRGGWAENEIERLNKLIWRAK